MRTRSMRRRRQGFTLIELVVVVAILAALAGLVIAKVDFLRRQATMAVAASTSGDVNNNLEMYLTTNSTIPNGLDSLLVSGTDGLIPTLIGTNDGVGSLPGALTTTTLPSSSTDNRLNSLFRMGLSVVNDHTLVNSKGAPVNATDSGTTPRIIGSITPAGPTGSLAAGSDTTFAVVTTGSSIWKSVYPPAVWNGSASPTYASTTEMPIDSLGNQVSLVALGVGPGASTNGVTMATPPQFPGPDSNLFYYRYVAIYAVYTDGRRAQLKTVVDSFGRTIDSALSNYSSAAPDDVPPGARTPE